MSLYEINQAIIDAVDSCLDPETGEMTGTVDAAKAVTSLSPTRSTAICATGAIGR